MRQINRSFLTGMMALVMALFATAAARAQQQQSFDDFTGNWGLHAREIAHDVAVALGKPEAFADKKTKPNDALLLENLKDFIVHTRSLASKLKGFPPAFSLRLRPVREIAVALDKLAGDLDQALGELENSKSEAGATSSLQHIMVLLTRALVDLPQL
jgi:hypothetical protein